MRLNINQPYITQNTTDKLAKEATIHSLSISWCFWVKMKPVLHTVIFLKISKSERELWKSIFFSNMIPLICASFECKGEKWQLLRNIFFYILHTKLLMLSSQLYCLIDTPIKRCTYSILVHKPLNLGKIYIWTLWSNGN